MKESKRDKSRYFLKDSIRQEIDFSQTDQNRGLPAPEIQKSCPEGVERIKLVKPEEFRDISKLDVYTAILNRRSRRNFKSDALSIKELSFLLWATQGVRKVADSGTAFRTVPSAGCRHALETYLCVFNVEGLEEGIYHYLPLEHEVHIAARHDGLRAQLASATLGQDFIARSAVTFVWTTMPYRMEWRYDNASVKVIAIDAGHVCQNLYTACEAIGAGTCAIAAYDQFLMDELLGVDGEDEFTIYLAPVGKF
jgi:SagB-type dehydrogenase family enzyme